jgi:hypothetical protein
MQASIFEHLEHVRPAAKYSRPVARRITILENNVRELQKYHDKAGKHKKTTIMRLIARYEDCIARLNSLI